jgi:hypothetical protein
MIKAENNKPNPSANEVPLIRPASIGKEVELFVTHMDSLSDSLPYVNNVLQHLGKQFGQAVSEFIVAHGRPDTTQPGTRRVFIPPEHVRQWNRLNTRVNRNKAASELVPRSLFVALVSQFDAYLGRLLHAIFLLKPETLNPSEKQLPFSQLATFPSIDAAREYIIEKEVESVLRSSHADQFKWMEQRFGVQLRSGLQIWSDYIELTERRNLFVHADGVVSSQYLTICTEHGVKFDGVVVEGARLSVSPKYFRASYECLYEIGVKLAHVLWRKLLPDDRAQADANFVAATYLLVEQDDYHLACALLDFGCEHFKKFSDEWKQLVLTVNRAQSHKWRGDADRCAAIMKSIDWSAKGDEFKLADAALAERWDEAFLAMKRIGPKGPVQQNSYRDWPVFKQLREQEQFKAVYKEIFGTEFSAAAAKALPDPAKAALEAFPDLPLSGSSASRPNAATTPPPPLAQKPDGENPRRQ